MAKYTEHRVTNVVVIFSCVFADRALHHRGRAEEQPVCKLIIENFLPAENLHRHLHLHSHQEGVHPEARSSWWARTTRARIREHMESHARTTRKWSCPRRQGRGASILRDSFASLFHSALAISPALRSFTVTLLQYSPFPASLRTVACYCVCSWEFAV
ncbi:hypothetical protein KC19_3G256100 [Ceratodon purpureus]|uniref:Uncharacterized protein n=1 Tax=Ceratodon purpureus TaxID=3225 RepID=A0A8T0IPV4_CERPU|nr:hypothetical protein KC19_3G256100 [Ceratodon purpureus]